MNNSTKTNPYDEINIILAEAIDKCKQVLVNSLKEETFDPTLEMIGTYLTQIKELLEQENNQ